MKNFCPWPVDHCVLESGHNTPINLRHCYFNLLLAIVISTSLYPQWNVGFGYWQFT